MDKCIIDIRQPDYITIGTDKNERETIINNDLVIKL